MKRLIINIFVLLAAFTLNAQEVTQSKMKEIFEKIKTPYKYGLVIAPTTNHYKADCPTVFRKDNKWYMTYLVYNGKTGTDGRGYETWLAESDNLLDWNTKGRILSFRNGFWDASQRGGFPALPDMEWGGKYGLQPFKGKYWMTYIGGANPGYETGPLKIGIASTPEKNLTEAIEWSAPAKPLMSPDDKDHQYFENITQYKSTIYFDKDKKLGYPFVMFYNAGGKHPETHIKAERIGIALSNDMKKWKRYPGNPVFTHEEGITGDAHIQKIGDLYVMFYFSAFRADRPYKAFNTFACSYDLIHWYDWKGEDLIIPSKEYDDLFAHKSYVIHHEGIVYHFYCAVNQFDQRGIAVATSKPVGKSTHKFPKPEVKERRTILPLNEGWKTWRDKDTSVVNIPHNYDDYQGYRQLTHGNLHGDAWYAKSFIAPAFESNKQYFLRFEGVGTYATVILNGKNLGRHLSGRTTFTLNVSKEILPGKENQLLVKAEHPSMITDMPWVCGGCSSEWGFSEGSQPFGIFRPVVMEITDPVRIEPFGVYIRNNDRADSIFIETEICNYSTEDKEIEVVNKLNNDEGTAVFRLAEKHFIKAGEKKIIRQSSPISDPHLWSPQRPYLYKLATMIKQGNQLTTDEITTPFGVRTISWPVKRNDGDGKFYLNNQPLFINGVCEYEHQFGQSHAFSGEQVAGRVKQIQNAGFNAFRDAHQPHHLDYTTLLDKKGILYWTQFSAHIWYDTPEFRNHFKQLLRQWVKERRNAPSVVMWGLQNESVLPKDFAEECTRIIREMDPTANNMRVITTCNGGEGTDWNVVQNWSGTYGGNIHNYGRELARKDQLLNGEYGAWRTLGFHQEADTFDANGAWTEDRACKLLEMKIKLAELSKDSVSGQFQWIYSSHDNPGRKQPDEAFRKIDKVGPFNYKGLVTPWEEPTDAYYLYKANYVSPAKDPVVYIVSHTWPDRFDKRKRANIEVYSNCDSVKLYNDVTGQIYLGRKKNNGKGTHFTWENRDIRYNVLKAVGYHGGKAVTEDVIVLNHLEKAPDFDSLYQHVKPLLKAETGYNYLYRVNCGGDSYTDTYKQTWEKDDTRFSTSWATKFNDLNPYQASQRVSYDPVSGVRDWKLFNHFRFGRHQLQYHFDLPDGKYRVELYFVEPWHGTGTTFRNDSEGLRIFDVAINGKTVIDDLDIWAEAGHDAALKKTVEVEISGGKMIINFPEVKAGQALISAIAIATTDPNKKIVMKPQTDWSWENQDKITLEKTPKELLPEDKNQRISTIYEAEKAEIKGNYRNTEHKNKKGVQFTGTALLNWKFATGLAQVYALRFQYMNNTHEPKIIQYQLMSSNGNIIREDQITFPPTKEKWKIVNTTTGSFINAGNYQLILSSEDMSGLTFDYLEVQ